MGKSVPKTTALVVSAIRKLREVQGSTSREIMNFITSEYDVSGSTVKRQLQAALKRGVEYGILKCHHGHYTLSTDATGGAVSSIGESGPVDKCRKKRRKYRKCKKSRRCARGCVRRRRKKKCGNRHGRGMRSSRHGKTIDADNLALDTLNAERSHRSSRSTRSRSRSRSGHSSAIGVRESSSDRRDKGIE